MVYKIGNVDVISLMATITRNGDSDTAGEIISGGKRWQDVYKNSGVTTEKIMSYKSGIFPTGEDVGRVDLPYRMGSISACARKGYRPSMLVEIYSLYAGGAWNSSVRRYICAKDGDLSVSESSNMAGAIVIDGTAGKNLHTLFFSLQGGGGAGGSQTDSPITDGGGGGGGAGGYIQGYLTLNDGEIYEIAVGGGGTCDDGINTPGRNGVDTYIAKSDDVLCRAKGGEGGQVAENPDLENTRRGGAGGGTESKSPFIKIRSASGGGGGYGGRALSSYVANGYGTTLVPAGSLVERGTLAGQAGVAGGGSPGAGGGGGGAVYDKGGDGASGSTNSGGGVNGSGGGGGHPIVLITSIRRGGNGGQGFLKISY